MVVKSGAPVRSVNAGEFDPAALSRIDTKQYYSAAKHMKGVEPVPQSGFRLMGGTRRMMACRKPLAALSVTGITVDNGPHAVAFTLWTGTVNGTVAVVHMPGLSCNAGTCQIIAEALVAGVWTAIAPAAFVVDADVTDRTAAFAPQEGRTATQVRIRAVPSVNASVTIGTVAVMTETGTPVVSRCVALNPDSGDKLSVMISAGIADICDVSGYRGSALLPQTSAAMLPDLDFYAEADTVGIAHPSTVPTQRMRRFGSGAHEWAVDEWPFDPAPEVQLDGIYVKTTDVWDIMLTWEGAVEIYISLKIDGEQTPAISLKHLGTVITANLASGTDFDDFAAEVQTAVQALPGLGAGVTVTAANVSGTGTYKLILSFGGAFAGSEYQVTGDVVNTVKAAANPIHVTIGETSGEPLFSPTRGFPGLFELVQDRMAHGRIPAKSGSLALSRAAEYFDLNIKAQNDAAARLDNLRSQTTETILAIKSSKYLLVGTDQGIYFAVNRTIERNVPLNFVQASETGVRANTKITDLDGVLYYVSQNGEQLLSLIYDDVSTSYSADPQSLLASHLVSGIKRTARQKAQVDQDAGRLWLMRDDGRLICAQLIRNQDITGFCEWRCASGGLVRETSVDGNNRLWMQVHRNGAWQWELYENDFLLQGTVITRCDLNGNIANLKHVSGTVYAVAFASNGDPIVLGPFTVNAGQIALGDFYDGDIHVGPWIEPDWESMPQPFVGPNDSIIFRPGRIHTAHLNLIDTTSIAIGANGGVARDFPLREANDPVAMPVPPKTRLITKTSMLGRQVGPTLQITQVRPGRLRVRDLAIEADL